MEVQMHLPVTVTDRLDDLLHTVSHSVVGLSHQPRVIGVLAAATRAPIGTHHRLWCLAVSIVLLPTPITLNNRHGATSDSRENIGFRLS